MPCLPNALRGPSSQCPRTPHVTEKDYIFTIVIPNTKRSYVSKDVTQVREKWPQDSARSWQVFGFVRRKFSADGIQTIGR